MILFPTAIWLLVMLAAADFVAMVESYLDGSRIGNLNALPLELVAWAMVIWNDHEQRMRLKRLKIGVCVDLHPLSFQITV